MRGNRVHRAADVRRPCSFLADPLPMPARLILCGLAYELAFVYLVQPSACQPSGRPTYQGRGCSCTEPATGCEQAVLISLIRVTCNAHADPELMPTRLIWLRRARL